RRIESLKQGQQVIGNRVRTRVVKNKVAPPFRVAEFDMMFTGKRSGISREGDILDMGVDYGILKKLGAFYSYGEMRLGQGRENARNFLIENEPLAGEIEDKVRAAAAAALIVPVSSNGARGKAVASDEDEDEDEPEDEG
ncbi:MAG TPA: DNA recombination/repair protein RecA, partial [Dehalococcoidia bacterium]